MCKPMPFKTNNNFVLLRDAGTAVAGTLESRLGRFQGEILHVPNSLDDCFFFNIFQILTTNFLGLGIVHNGEMLWHQCQKQSKK